MRCNTIWTAAFGGWGCNIIWTRMLERGATLLGGVYLSFVNNTFLSMTHFEGKNEPPIVGEFALSTTRRIFLVNLPSIHTFSGKVVFCILRLWGIFFVRWGPLFKDLNFFFTFFPGTQEKKTTNWESRVKFFWCVRALVSFFLHSGWGRDFFFLFSTALPWNQLF